MEIQCLQSEEEYFPIQLCQEVIQVINVKAVIVR